MPVKKGQELELTIESLAYGGKGIARVDDFVIFVKTFRSFDLEKSRILVIVQYYAYYVIGKEGR